MVRVITSNRTSRAASRMSAAVPGRVRPLGAAEPGVASAHLAAALVTISDEVDHCIDSRGTEADRSAESALQKCPADALASSGLDNGETVEMTPPPVPTDDQRSAKHRHSAGCVGSIACDWPPRGVGGDDSLHVRPRRPSCSSTRYRRQPHRAESARRPLQHLTVQICRSVLLPCGPACAGPQDQII